MRLAWLLRVQTACDPPLPKDCPRACEPDDRDCGTSPHEELPARCSEICSVHACCELMNGTWHKQTFDCARPRDAGVDAVPDGAPDA